MKRLELLLVLAAPVAGWAQQGKTLAAVDGVEVWPGGVPPHGLKEKDDFGNHAISISHREKSGEAEVHLTKADVLVIQSGEATLVYGGTTIDPRSTGANEVHGSGIRGGTSREVKAGDVIHIAVGVPHQFLLAPGKQITYLVVKVVDSEVAGRAGAAHR